MGTTCALARVRAVVVERRLDHHAEQAQLGRQQLAGARAAALDEELDVERLAQQLAHVGAEDRAVELVALEDAAQEEGAAAAEEEAERPEGQVGAGGDVRRHQIVLEEHVRQHQIVDVALVRRDDQQRPLARGRPHPLEARDVDLEAVEDLAATPRPGSAARSRTSTASGSAAISRSAVRARFSTCRGGQLLGARDLLGLGDQAPAAQHLLAGCARTSCAAARARRAPRTRAARRAASAAAAPAPRRWRPALLRQKLRQLERLADEHLRILVVVEEGPHGAQRARAPRARRRSRSMMPRCDRAARTAGDPHTSVSGTKMIGRPAWPRSRWMRISSST